MFTAQNIVSTSIRGIPEVPISEFDGERQVTIVSRPSNTIGSIATSYNTVVEALQVCLIPVLSV